MMPHVSCNDATGIGQTTALLPQSPRMPGLERLRGSRLFIPCCGITLLAVFSVLYVADTALYMHILIWMTRNPSPHPFIDWEWIPSAVQCWQRGVDVYADNTCYEPIAHGRHGYSPLWLRFTFLPYGKVWLMPFGLGFAVLFFAALAALPPQRRAEAFWLTFLATFSPMTTFALERGNVDLIMFMLAITGVSCWLGTLRLRLLGYGIFILAGLLKFYPLVLLILTLRERPRVFVGLCAATLAVLLAFGLEFHDEMGRAGANIPSGSYFIDTFAAANLPFGLVSMITGIAEKLGNHNTLFGKVVPTMLGAAGLLLMTLTAFQRAAQLSRRFELGPALAAMPPQEAGFLVAGTVLICACFFAGENVGYRAIMILPTLPGLLWLGRSLSDRVARIFFMATCGTVVFVLWKIPIWQVTEVLVARHALIFAYWLIDGLAWWWVVTVLLAVLLGFVLNSEVVQLTARHLRLSAAGGNLKMGTPPHLLLSRSHE